MVIQLGQCFYWRLFETFSSVMLSSVILQLLYTWAAPVVIIQYM